MPYPPTHKPQSREKILQSAAKLFTQHGFERVSIDQIMADAGLTRGAFYSHFADKGALYAEAIVYAARHRFTHYLKGAVSGGELPHLLATYLSQAHVTEENIACPLAFLANDVSQRDLSVRNTYTRIYKALVKQLPTLSSKNPERNTCLAVSALMIGGVAIARALNNPALVEELLAACRETSLELLGEAG
jgi:TetR/AcrR family transcriptional repressor of nem operon